MQINTAEQRTVPALPPKSGCCGYRWKLYKMTRGDLINYTRKLIKSMPRGANPAEPQQAKIAELKEIVGQAKTAYFEHIDDTSLEHK